MLALGLSDVADIVATVNAANTSWTAHPWPGSSDARRLCGTFVKGDPRCKRHLLLLDNEPDFINLRATDLPAEFDLRTIHTNCTVISKIRDQSACA